MKKFLCMCVWLFCMNLTAGIEHSQFARSDFPAILARWLGVGYESKILQKFTIQVADVAGTGIGEGCYAYPVIGVPKAFKLAERWKDVNRKTETYAKLSYAVMGTMFAVTLVMAAVYDKNSHVYDNVSRIAVWPFCAVLGLSGSVALQHSMSYREVSAVKLSTAPQLLDRVRYHLEDSSELPPHIPYPIEESDLEVHRQYLEQYLRAQEKEPKQYDFFVGKKPVWCTNIMPKNHKKKDKIMAKHLPPIDLF